MEKKFIKYELTKEEYFELRDYAWMFLYNNKVISLPVDIEGLIKKQGWHLLDYNNPVVEKLDKNGCRFAKPAFSRFLDGEYYICYSPDLPEAVRRYSLAHEVGHIILNDIENPTKNSEAKAEFIACRILAPICVLKELNIKTAEEVEEVCNISIQAAKSRFKRLNMLYSRDKFYLSPLEVRVLANFLPWIKKNKK